MLTDKQGLSYIENVGKENVMLEVGDFTDNDLLLDRVKNMIRVEKENIRQEFMLQIRDTIEEFKHISNSICIKYDEKNFDMLKNNKDVESQIHRLNYKFNSFQNMNNFFGSVGKSDQKAMSANLNSSPENESVKVHHFDRDSKSIPIDRDDETQYNLGRSVDR